jgi:GntR family transcriptional regulator
MKLEIDHTLQEPFYLQIAEQIQAQIVSGEVVPGQRLPTVRSLGEELGVNFNTVARAYRYLERLGWIVARQGRGAFVQIPTQKMEQEEKEEKLKRHVEKFLHTGWHMGFSNEEMHRAVAQRAAAKARA